MTSTLIGSSAETTMHALSAAPASLAILVEQAITATIPAETARLAVNGDPETLASLGRAIAVQEGYLVEAVVTALAATHPDRLTLIGLRLPLLPAALDLIRKNRKSLYEGLSLDATARSATTYHPDLVIADPRTRSALIVDVKRSLSGYLGSSKLAELQQRMTASGLVLPDILWRDHQRLAVETVGTAIIDASRTSNDVSDGIWPLSRLDELLDVAQAGQHATDCVEAFRTGVRVVWQNALRSTMPEPSVTSATTSGDTSVSNTVPRRRGRPSRQVKSAHPPSLVTVGLFQPTGRTH